MQIQIELIINAVFKNYSLKKKKERQALRSITKFVLFRRDKQWYHIKLCNMDPTNQMENGALYIGSLTLLEFIFLTLSKNFI